MTEYDISPDGLFVVYLVDHSANGRFEVYSVPIDRSDVPLRLNDVFNSGRVVLAFEISSDSYHVVFVGDCTTDDVNEIYSVHIRRVSPPVRLNPTLVAGGDVGRHNGDLFAISPDARRVVYIADQETDDVYELFSVSIDGAPAAAKLNGPLHANGLVDSFEIAATSQRVVFLASPPVLGSRRLYSVVITGERGAARADGRAHAGRLHLVLRPRPLRVPGRLRGRPGHAVRARALPRPRPGNPRPGEAERAGQRHVQHGRVPLLAARATASCIAATRSCPTSTSSSRAGWARCRYRRPRRRCSSGARRHRSSQDPVG